MLRYEAFPVVSLATTLKSMNEKYHALLKRGLMSLMSVDHRRDGRDADYELHV